PRRAARDLLSFPTRRSSDLALLADRPAWQDAAPARPDVSRRDPLSPSPALCERVAASRPARSVSGTGARRPRLSGRARRPVAAPAGGGDRRRDRALLRARHLGDGRVARAVSPLRRPGGMGQGGGAA